MPNPSDPFYKEYEFNLANPASRIVAVTPADADLAIDFKALRVYNPTTDAVNVKITTVGGDDAVLPFGPGLSIESLRVKRVWATGTTAGLTIHGYTD